MIDRPEVLALAEAYEHWHAMNAIWQPTAGESILCRECEDSLFSDASGLRGVAPHSILHSLRNRLEWATNDVAHELWLACDRCDDVDDDRCGHQVDARVRVLDQLALAGVDLISAAEHLLRKRHGWEREYALRRLDEFLSDARGWKPSAAMLAAEECTICSMHPLRGEAHVRRLPHDVRHELYALVEEVADEFTGTSFLRPNLLSTRVVTSDYRWGRSLMLGLVVQSQLGMSAFVDTVVDAARADWIVDHRPLSLDDVAREEALAAVRPMWEAQFQVKLGEVVERARALEAPTHWSRSGEIGRSPYAVAACPDLHWPAWLLSELVTISVDMRWSVCRNASASTSVTFDAWLFERLRSLTLFEHRLAYIVERQHGESHRRQLGLRLLAPVSDSIIDDLS